MKKLILTAALASVTALSGFSQGIVAFQNALTSRIYFNSTATTANYATGATIGAQTGNTSAGVVDVGLWWSTAAFTDSAQGTLQQINNMSSTAGQFAGQAALPLPGTVAGQSVYVQVFAWDSTYANPDLAIAAGAYFGAYSAGPANTVYGAIGSAQLIASLNVAPGVANGIFGTAPGQFQRLALLPGTPEPATIALGGLGAAALLLFRRRK